MAQERNYLMHPYIIAIYLLIAGLSFIFLAFSASYIYNRVQSGIPPIQLPYLFYVNTFILLASSATLYLTKQAYLQDNTGKYQLYLWLTLLLSIMFLGMQVLAWNQLIQSGILLTQSNMASYVYVVSAVHLLHVVVGIPFLMAFIYVAHYRMKEPVSVLIYFADPDKLRKLKILTIYWHFLDLLWIYLVVFFAVNSLIG